MKKILFGLLASLLVGMVALAGPASSATGQPDAANKSVTFCHYAGSNDHGGSGNYVKLTTSVMAFYQAGHINHSNDIWEAFSYTTHGGEVVNVPAQGNTSLLAFDDCQQPKTDEEIPAPDFSFVDKCGTEDDTASVAPGRGYTVGTPVWNGNTVTIPVTADEGFVFANGQKSLSFSHTFTNNEDCGLPNTGGSAEYATLAGGLSVLAIVGLAVATVVNRRRKPSQG